MRAVNAAEPQTDAPPAVAEVTWLAVFILSRTKPAKAEPRFCLLMRKATAAPLCHTRWKRNTPLGAAVSLSPVFVTSIVVVPSLAIVMSLALINSFSGCFWERTTSRW